MVRYTDTLFDSLSRRLDIDICLHICHQKIHLCNQLLSCFISLFRNIFDSINTPQKQQLFSEHSILKLKIDTIESSQNSLQLTYTSKFFLSFLQIIFLTYTCMYTLNLIQQVYCDVLQHNMITYVTSNMNIFLMQCNCHFHNYCYYRYC